MYNYAKEVLTVENNEIELSNRADEIDVKTQAKEMREINTAIKQTMEKENLVMLAAPEIGLKRRIFGIRFDTEIKIFINPMLIEGEDVQLAREVSVVLPGKQYIRPRHAKVTVLYQRPTGQVESRQFIGRAAVYMQQMIDALDGILDSDIGLEIDDDFDNGADEERDAIIKMYLESLDLKAAEINKEIEDSPELKEQRDAIEFMKQVATGETKLEGQK